MTLRILATDADLAWDGVLQHIPRGTVVDVPVGSALEVAYGASLVNLTPTDQASISEGSKAAVAN
jgi:hypothetical protein